MDEDPVYDISVACVDGEPVVGEARLTQVVEETLRRHHVTAASITLALVDDQRIASLNERHLRHEGPTDVLTFDLREESAAVESLPPSLPTPAPPGTVRVIDGEIVMSVETAAREAKRLGHAIEAELALYAVHGTLHLLGYDDQSTADAKRMHGVEDEILQAIGLGAVYEAGKR